MEEMYLMSIGGDLTQYGGPRMCGAITGFSAASCGSEVTGETDLDLAIPEMWSSAIYGYFEAKLILRGICDDYSSMVVGKGDTINIPEIPEVTGLTDKTEGASVLYGDESLVDTNLLINKHKYVAKMFEDLGVIQANESLFGKYAQAMGYQLAKQIDTDILAQLDDLGTTQTLTTDNVISLNDAETVVSTLLDNNLDVDDCVWIVNSKIYADWLAQGVIKQSFNAPANYATSGSLANTVNSGIDFNGATVGGTVPSFFGMPVLTSSLIGSAAGTGNEVAYCVKKGCVALAVQQDVRVQSEYSVDYLATKVVADVIYGTLKMTTNKVMGIELLNP